MAVHTGHAAPDSLRRMPLAKDLTGMGNGIRRQENIRNFCIIAHIDHGKSTLADRLLQITDTIPKREFRDQVLDDMDLERERGITIKAHHVQMTYAGGGEGPHTLNLIDTPGHVDFSYEVSRSLAACEGALLVIDASQGIQAQTVANLYLAVANDLEIIPVINKIDLPNADVEATMRQIADLIGASGDEVLTVSAKNGTGIGEVIETIIGKVPPPSGDAAAPLRALIFDSVFNSFRGVIIHVRIFDGNVAPGQKIKLLSTGKSYEVAEVGVFRPGATPVERLSVGDVGYLIATIKDTAEVKIGDTVTLEETPCASPLPGFKELRPMVYSGLYPASSADYDALRSALERLSLNDPAFVYQNESSAALGLGFRCGYLGLLHMEIVQERLQREYDLDIIMTTPNVIYEMKMRDGRTLSLDNPVRFPDRSETAEFREPFIRAFVICPTDCIGRILKLARERRGECVATETLGGRSVILTFELPLNEVVIDFYDLIKSTTRGYGSLDYEYIGTRPSDMVKLEILVGGEPVDAFSSIVHRSKATEKARKMLVKLKDVIPRHLFQVVLQARAGGKIIARETIKALKKDVTAGLYGGDITRKMKLREKQKAGKKRMKKVGKVNIPQNAFIAVMKPD